MGHPHRTESVSARRAGVWLMIAGLCVALPAGADGPSSGRRPELWVDETILTPEERREFEARRAAVEARAEALAAREGPCGDLRSRVRQDLADVQHVRAVEVGLVLLTSDPPRMPVTFAISLTSGRLVWDRLTVTVPVRPSVVPLGRASDDPPVPRCRPAGR
jgi:hypothetical protein